MKKLFVILLAVVCLFSGCDITDTVKKEIKEIIKEEIEEELEKDKESSGFGEQDRVEVIVTSRPTPRPTPKPTVVDVSATQANNYYVAYTVSKFGEIVEDENGNMVEKVEPDKYVEVGFSGLVLSSSDGGESFFSANTNCFSSTADISTNPKSVFSIHLNYNDDQLEEKGVETVAGRECKHYIFKNNRMIYHMYVDESFGTTGICLKFVAEGYKPQTIEVTELKFDVINKEDGYNFVDFQMRIATPKPNN